MNPESHVPHPAYPGSVPPPLDPHMSGVNALHPESMTNSELEKQRRRSKWTAMGVALLAHGVILLLAFLIIVANYVKDTPIIEVTGEGDAPATLEKKQFQQRVTRRPSAASSNPLPTIVSNTASPLAIPEVDEIVDDPMDLGVAGIGEGLGFGTSGAGMGGGASFLGLSGGGKNIILVIDTSSSMPGNCKPEGIEAIRREIAKTITALAPNTRFNLVCYANDADLFQEKPVPANAQNKKDALKFMEGYFGAGPWLRTRTEKYGERDKDAEGTPYVAMPPGKVEALKGTSGGSRIDLGIVLALTMKPSTVFVLSDGEPSTAKAGNRLSQKQIIDLVEDEYKRIYEGSAGGVKVNTVSINGQGEKFLRDIARSFGGKHKDIKPDRL